MKNYSKNFFIWLLIISVNVSVFFYLIFIELKKYIAVDQNIFELDNYLFLVVSLVLTVGPILLYRIPLIFHKRILSGINILAIVIALFFFYKMETCTGKFCDLSFFLLIIATFIFTLTFRLVFALFAYLYKSENYYKYKVVVSLFLLVTLFNIICLIGIGKYIYQDISLASLKNRNGVTVSEMVKICTKYERGRRNVCVLQAIRMNPNIDLCIFAELEETDCNYYKDNLEFIRQLDRY